MKLTTSLGLGSLAATTALLLVGMPAYSASLSLVPRGTQLDSDPIFARSTNIGDVINFTFRLNTDGLTANLTNLVFSVARDAAELPLIGLDNSSSQAVFPNLNIFTIALSDPRSEVRGATLSGSGVAPNTTIDLFTTSYRVGSALMDDGLSDLRIIEILTATDANGNDVRSAFQVDNSGVDVQQPIPEPSLVMGLSVLGIGLLVNKAKKKNSETV